MMANYPMGNVHQVAGNIELKYRREVKFGLEKWEWPVKEWERKPWQGFKSLAREEMKSNWSQRSLGTQIVQKGRELSKKLGMASSVANAKGKLGLRKVHYLWPVYRKTYSSHVHQHKQAHCLLYVIGSQSLSVCFPPSLPPSLPLPSVIHTLWFPSSFSDCPGE